MTFVLWLATAEISLKCIAQCLPHLSVSISAKILLLSANLTTISAPFELEGVHHQLISSCFPREVCLNSDPFTMSSSSLQSPCKLNLGPILPWIHHNSHYLQWLCHTWNSIRTWHRPILYNDKLSFFFLFSSFSLILLLLLLLLLTYCYCLQIFGSLRNSFNVIRSCHASKLMYLKHCLFYYISKDTMAIRPLFHKMQLSCVFSGFFTFYLLTSFANCFSVLWQSTCSMLQMTKYFIVVFIFLPPPLFWAPVWFYTSPSSAGDVQSI